jgi:gamma-glutamylputrescine oxidase
MSVSFWQDKGLKCDDDFDFIIIGAGVAGLSSAYWLLREDCRLRVAIVEKYTIGSGATGRNAGFVTCGSVEHFNRMIQTFGTDNALEIWNFSEENLDLLKSELNVGSSVDFCQNGSFSLASTQSELEELSKSAKLMKESKIQVESLSEKEIEKRLNITGFCGGIKYIKDAQIHPMKLLMKLKNEILKLNSKTKIFENNEVFKIEGQGDKRIVKTSESSYQCDMVVFATNGYSELLNPYFENKILPTRGQMQITESVPQFLEGPCYANFVLDYFRQLRTGEVIIGGFRQLNKDVEKGYSDETTAIVQQALSEFLLAHMPKLKDAKITHRWSGIMGFSVDGQPLIGLLPTDNQQAFIGGFTAHGLGLSFNSAKKLVDLIYGRKIPDFINAKRL